jgi:hypothetical protein
MARSKRYPPDIITADQCRAARAWLNWTQAELGHLSYLGTSTIKEFEAGLRQPHASSLTQLQRTLEDAGIKFIVDGQQRGIAVLATPEPYRATLDLMRESKKESDARLNPRATVRPIQRKTNKDPRHSGKPKKGR